MLEEKGPREGKSVLDRPDLVRREAAVRAKPVKKGKRWILKIILILIIIFVFYYLFKNPDTIREPVDKFFERFT